jgi:hypothetical protein
MTVNLVPIARKASPPKTDPANEAPASVTRKTAKESQLRVSRNDLVICNSCYSGVERKLTGHRKQHSQYTNSSFQNPDFFTAAFRSPLLTHFKMPAAGMAMYAFALLMEAIVFLYTI